MAARTKEEILSLANIDPELVEVLKKVQYPAFDFSDQDKALQQLRAATNSRNVQDPDPEVFESKLTFKARDQFELNLLVFKPSTPTSSSSPIFVFFHGGGGSLGSPENTIPLCRNVVKHFGAVCVAPQYRLAPEHKWPTGTNDAWDGVKWVAANVETLGASPSAGFVLGGVSNGATLSSTLAHLARDEKLSPPLTGLFLSAGSYVTPAAVPEQYKDRYLSRYQDACLDAPILNRPTKKLFDDCIQYDPHSPYHASLLWSSGHSGLPPTYFQACGMDINRDDSLIYEQVLREEGVRTRLDMYPGMPHIFWGVFPMLKQSKKWQGDTLKGVAWLFGKEARM